MTRFIFLFISFFFIPLRYVFSADDITLQSISFRNSPPALNIANTLYATFKNNNATIDRTRVIQFTYAAANGQSINFGSSKSIDIVAGGTVQTYIDGSFSVHGNVPVTVHVYGGQANVCTPNNAGNVLVASYTKQVFVDGDNDGDGIPDAIDPDDDNDGLSDAREHQIGTDQFNPDSDGDGLKDGVDPCPLDPLNRCVPSVTPATPSLQASTQSQNKSSQSRSGETDANTLVAALNILINGAIPPNANVDGIQTSSQTTQSIAGAAINFSPSNSCTRCTVLPVLFGVIAATAIYVYLIKRKNQSQVNKPGFLLGLLIPTACSFVFISINQPCMRPMFIFPSQNLLCRWFIGISYAIYSLPMLVLYVRSKKK